MAKPQQSQTPLWRYGFRIGEEEAIRLATRVKAQEPEGSKKLDKLPEDLSTHYRQKPFEEQRPDEERMVEIQSWAWDHIEEETGVKVYSKLDEDVAIPLPGDAEEFPYEPCGFITFIKRTAADPDKLDITACEEYDTCKEDIERLRKVLLDEPGWYLSYKEAFDEYEEKREGVKLQSSDSA
ncbi:hypothetical protein C8T65DRAFT_830903 [Cerioporus squamosus]|nr:hypothetical protein C8T65DRAFT_830903 [Cerioporus squamosus]